MDAQTKLLHDLWKTAFRQEEPVVVPCPSASAATRLRFAMYNAAKPVKEGKLVDPELLEAVNNCSVGFVEGDKAKLQVRKKIMTDLMQAVQAVIAPELRTEAPAKTEEEAAIAESLAALQKKLNADEQAAPRTTPYYTRER